MLARINCPICGLEHAVSPRSGAMDRNEPQLQGCFGEGKDESVPAHWFAVRFAITARVVMVENGNETAAG